MINVKYTPVYLSSCSGIPRQPNHTHQNSNITAAKNPTQAFQPTPVFCAILNIRFMVPLILCLEFSN